MYSQYEVTHLNNNYCYGYNNNIMYKTTNCFVFSVVLVEVIFSHDSLKVSFSDQYLYRDQVNKVIKDIRLDVIME